MHFETFLALIFSLEKWVFFDFFDFFGQNRQKSKLWIFQALEKGATSHFKCLKTSFSKNFGILEYFCTFFQVLTPKTRRVTAV